MLQNWMKDLQGFRGKPEDYPDVNDQQRFWNEWNASYREQRNLDPASRRRSETVLALVRALNLSNPRILEVGCANGWLSEKLEAFGSVTGVDLADEVIARAKVRVPNVSFVAGDFMQLGFSSDFDLVVCLETITSVVDQAGFIGRIAATLKSGGYLILTTVNKFVFERRDDVDPLAPGQVRKWVSRGNMKRLLRPHFDRVRITTISPAGHGGFLRIVNSPKLNSLLGMLLSERLIMWLKEEAGFGQTIVILARKRAGVSGSKTLH